ncbi:MAG TPA: AAA family ATPase [Blastocatellia bacterium]|jgi:NadR type nicotinamide-nucleotide adenylyltransferase
MPGRGLIVGKFYPPHRGHKHLIDFARSRVDELSVIVCRKPGEFPAGELRAAWLREIHPDANVLLIDDVYDEQDSRVWAENSVRWLGFVPDVVFTSEDYGEPFAHFLGCEHVLVDRNREAVPVSGTMVRSNPLGFWNFLEPPVRAWYAKRICLVGAESTGKTTLARMLAEHYRTVWVPEYGREYSERKLAEDGGYDWRSEEFTLIAKTQIERENEAARRANKVLICDTDAFATGVWHRRYMDEHSPEVEAIAAGHRRPDLYLLTNADTPFVQDGTRDGESIREWMHETFVAELTARRRSFRLLSGSLQERFNRAVECVDEVIAAKRSQSEED